MLSNREQKIIRSLKLKKYRSIEECFVIEGNKLLEEAIKSSFLIDSIYATTQWIASNPMEMEVNEIAERELKKISNFTTPPGCLAVVKFPKEKLEKSSDLILALEHIQDPGNLGTILRSSLAFGVYTVVCSADSVDCFSPKVVQASMGAIFHLNIVYTDLVEYLANNKSNMAIYGAHLKGNGLYKTKFKKPAILVMGNESQGLSKELSEQIEHQIKIEHSTLVESLNVSMATAILLSEFRRQFSLQ